MQGAKEYAKLFGTGYPLYGTEQFGKLCIVAGQHARGYTFRIFVLPNDAPAKWNGRNNAPLNEGMVQVYGVIDGQSGWTESYGWLHYGPWQDDFNSIVARRIFDNNLVEANKELVRLATIKEQLHSDHIVLSNY